MNTRALIWISAALNLAVAAGIFLLTQRRAPVAWPIEPAVAELTPAAANETNPPTALTPAAPVVATPFHWRQLASDDLKKYRDNLVSVGCPTLTVRDIIIGEINERFQPRWRALSARLQTRFWDLLVQGGDAFQGEIGPLLEAITAERQALIDDVLGNNFNPPASDSSTSPDEKLQHLSWLPPEKRARLVAIEEARQMRFEEWARYVGRRPDGQLTPEDNARLQQVQKEFEEAKKQVLTPEELEESRLRSSRESLWAMELPGFEVSEDEWRDVARLRVDWEEAQRQLGDPTLKLTDEERLKRMEELSVELTSATKTTLGAERFAEYERAGNTEFQEIYNVTRRYKLPQSVAVEAYNVEQAARAQVDQVLFDPGVSEEGRRAVLLLIQQETERTLAKTLGDKALSTYKEYGGYWLTGLGSK